MFSRFKSLAMSVLLIACLGVAAHADVVDVGPHESDYTGFSRGFSYTAPVEHVITQIELPLDRFAVGDLASFMIEINDVVQLYSVGNASGVLGTSILVQAGQEVLVLGNWTTGAAASFTAKNSYNGTSPYASSILGNPVDLFRAGFQFDIGAGTYTGGSGFTGIAGSHGRSFITVEAIPEPTSLTLFGLGGLVLLFKRRRRR